MPHHLQSEAEIVDQGVQALVRVIQELLHPLDVVRAQRDLQIAEHLGGRGLADHFPFLTKKVEEIKL